NFFRGMDDAIELGEDPVWLAVTSISFDISVLELLWTLSRGVPVVLQPERERVLPSSGVPAGRRSATAPGSPVAVRRAAADPHAPGRTMDVSLFYFSAEGGEGEEPPPPGRNRYRLLLEGARIGDRGGLSAIWTPERHFHEFGGIYPNPSVAGAAVAAITERIGIRAGSVVLPLHDPVRVAEEWSVIDNLSDGRVGLSFASGWHDRDFIFRPDAYDDRKERMFSDMEVLRSLWRGEEVQREAPDGEVGVRVYPRPVQPELPVWVTAGGSPETFRRAGEVGANLLTHLLGQSPDELEEKIGIYREARRKAGHRGRGQVSLMIHTYVGTSPDEVLERVRTPFRNYLRTSVGLIRAMARGDGRDLRMAELTEADMEALLDHAFARYFETSALMGTMDQAVEMALVLRDRDVDELACLVDFGVEEEATLAGIERLPELQGRVNEVLARDASPAAGVDASRSPESDGVEPLPMSRQAADLPETAGEAIRRWGGTHMQCTPSMARLLLAEADPGLDRLRALLVGGEALPASLAATLREQLRGGRLHNMYGPTETTIWSATTPVDGALEGESVVPLGAPIRGTVLEVLDRKGRRAPAGVPGELVIGGAGVVRGYLDRPELTGERFLPAGVDGQRRYRTGDRAMWSFRGHLRFLGRMDTQVKIRGHRVELGEIEAALSAHPSVGAAVAHIPASSDGPEERLLAWVTPVGNADPPRADVLLAHLRERLPAIMVPFAITVLDAFPLTPNGKVDRSRLPPPFPSRDREEGKEEGRKELARSPSQMARAPSGAAATELERTISRIWKEVLQVDRVRPDDNFFDLGGHSLLTVRVHARLSGEVDVPVSITDLFRHPTVRALADHLSDDDSGEGDQGLSDAARRAAARRRAMGGGRRGRGRS
ncbi:MAG: LLM class flavin-dependent oxidoreductase, partial [Gemmatimonadales bacterium]